VTISSGEVAAYNEPSLDRIYSHPRASADGRIAFAENGGSGWHVGSVNGAFSPEWSGSHLIASVASGGFIDLARVGVGPTSVGRPAEADPHTELLTRTNGAALDPAPAPDGSIYFMSLEPDGFVIRHLAAPEAVTSRPILETRLAPAIPPVITSAVTFAHEAVPPPRAYTFGRQEIAGLAGGAWTAYQRFGEYGLRIGDVLGRIDALAIVTNHDAAVAATWRGWPVAVTAHAFRHGLELHGNYRIHTPLSLASFEAGALGGSSSRGFVDAEFSAHARSNRATARIAFDSKQHARASLRVAAKLGGFGFAAMGEAARNMTVGGVVPSTTPDSLRLEHIIDPALPPAFAQQRTYRGVRGELHLGGLTAFWQRHSSATRVWGIEESLSGGPVPLLDLPALDLTAGVARVSGLRGTKGWLSLRWTP
jgi:hypothetical protein